MSLKTASPVMARRLATKLDAILDAAMLAETAQFHLSKRQIEVMLRTVVHRHLAKLEQVEAVAKSSWGFDVERAGAEVRRALWAYCKSRRATLDRERFYPLA